MATRLSASRRTTSLIEERLSTGSAGAELVKLATRLIVEEALEAGITTSMVRSPAKGTATGKVAGRRRPEGLIECARDLIPSSEGAPQPLKDLAIERWRESYPISSTVRSEVRHRNGYARAFVLPVQPLRGC